MQVEYQTQDGLYEMLVSIIVLECWSLFITLGSERVIFSCDEVMISLSKDSQLRLSGN